MQHTKEDLNTLEILKNEELKLHTVFDENHKLMVDFITQKFKNLPEETTLQVDLRQFMYWGKEFSINVHFTNKKYYWSSQFFLLEFSFSKENGLQFEPRCSSGGVQKDVDEMDALNCKADIYKSSIQFSTELKENKELLEELRNKMKHYQKVYREWSKKNDELNKFKQTLTHKENEFKANNLLKILKKPFNVEQRVEEISKFLFDKNKSNEIVQIVTLNVNNNSQQIEFKDLLIEMDNYKRLSLKINNKRASKTEVIEALKEEFYIDENFLQTIKNIDFIDSSKYKKDRDANAFYSIYNLEELYEIFKKSLNIYNF